tara:strand:+ start:1150 stop:2625 length:1476 start_codon:yes stop_codon:yes gene_type:complete
MALGYGYVRDDDPVQINWREISKNFTDRLQADEASRNKRKADIQQSYNDFQKDLINRPQGYNTDLNTAISSFSNQASQASLANLNALKSGQITEQEFYRRRANLKGSTENMFQYANNFNSKYDFYMKRALDGISSKEEIFMKELFQNYTNFKDIAPIIDPSSNEVLFVKLDKDGKVTDEVVDVTQLGFMSEYQKDKYDLGAAITDKLKQFGLKTIREADGREVTTLFDAAVDQKEFNNAIEKLADEILSVDENLRSILTDTLGYDFTTDTTELNKVFYNQKTNEFEETDQQRIDARNHIISEIKARIPRKEIEAPKRDLNKEIEQLLKIQKLQEDINYNQLRTRKLEQDIDLDPVQSEAALNTYFESNKPSFETILNNESLSNRQRANQTVAKLQPLLTRFNLTVDRTSGNKIRILAPMYNKSGQTLPTTNKTEDIDLNNSLDDIFTYIQNWIVSSQVDPVDKKKGIQGLIRPESETENETQIVEVDYPNL